MNDENKRYRIAIAGSIVFMILITSTFVYAMSIAVGISPVEEPVSYQSIYQNGGF